MQTSQPRRSVRKYKTGSKTCRSDDFLVLHTLNQMYYSHGLAVTSRFPSIFHEMNLTE